ncbi:MAG: selenium-dependent xanthine dehydrogenase, partial [Defluviitaleaceae bacterium]|nr:selenium-dependent xanthine dehydrogenase [Defluviitaleaceae bacterium]
EAILKAAAMFNGEAVTDAGAGAGVGAKLPRIDAKKVFDDKYTDDLVLPGMLYGNALRSKHPCAKVLSINTEKAKAAPGVAGVFTAADITAKRFLGHIVKDWPALVAVGEETKYIGDAIALVAAESKAELKAALELIEVEYEVLTPVTDPKEVMDDPEWILAKVTVQRGDYEDAFAKAAHVVTNKYSTPPTEHAFMEPECAVAAPDGDGLIIYTGGQSVYDDKREIMDITGLPEDKVRVVSMIVGGGFGGKEDMSVQHHAAFMAHKLRRPVKVLMSRKESIMTHPKRHAAEIEMTTACDKDGKLLAMRARIVMDTGAYASLGGPVVQRCCTHAGGPYNYQNVDIMGMAVTTNNPPAGAFRGFGVPQSAFAAESNLNQLAELVGISPWEIRYRNAIRPGEVLPNGQIADESTALAETLEAVKDAFHSHKYAGIACGIKNAGLGVGVPDVGRCIITVEDGKAQVRASAACIGQGMATVILQVFCETTGLSADDFVYVSPDTAETPDSGTTTASRQTLFTGEACRLASLELKKALGDGSLAALNGQKFSGEYAPPTDPMGSDKPNPVSHIAYGYATHVVAIDDEGKLEAVYAAHDVGRAINPISVEGQIEGGVTMALGYALTEDFPLKDGVPTAKFGTLGLFRSTDVPVIKPIIVEKNPAETAWGAKGVGEISSIPTAPAVQAAYYAKDKIFRKKLPLEGTYYKK